MTFAIVKVLPEPVTPSRTLARESVVQPLDQTRDRGRLIARGTEFRHQRETVTFVDGGLLGELRGFAYHGCRFREGKRVSLSVSERMSRVMPSATSAVLGLAAQLREEGKDVISLGAGEPDFDTPEHIKAAAIKAIHDGQTKYTAIDGTTALKDAIQRKFERDNGLSYAHNELLVSVGAKHTLFNLCMGVLSAGDEAIIPIPYWVSYPDMVRVAEGVPVFVDTGIDSDFKITPDQLREAITDRTRILFLNSPSNPSGSCYTREELEALGEVLVAHPEVVIAADDIYEHIHWGESPFCSIATAVPELKARPSRSTASPRPTR